MSAPAPAGRDDGAPDLDTWAVEPYRGDDATAPKIDHDGEWR